MNSLNNSLYQASLVFFMESRHQVIISPSFSTTTKADSATSVTAMLHNFSNIKILALYIAAVVDSRFISLDFNTMVSLGSYHRLLNILNKIRAASTPISKAG